MCSISHDLITFLLPVSSWLGGGGLAVGGLVIVSCSIGLNFQINFKIFCCFNTGCFKIKCPFLLLEELSKTALM